MGTLKQFLEGCVTVVEGIDRAQDAINSHRSGRHRGQQVIDVPSVAEYPSSQLDTQGAQGAPQLPRQIRAVNAQVRNIHERLAYIISMVQKSRHSGSVRAFAVKAISQKCGENWCTPEGDHEAEVIALFEECRNYYRYCGDAYGVDQFQHAERTLEWGGGDCDDATIMICSALGAVGFQTKARVIQTNKSNDWDHIYGLVGLPQRDPKKWVALDLSVQQPPGWEPPKHMVTRTKDFDIPL